jgi:hypothetical protein
MLEVAWDGIPVKFSWGKKIRGAHSRALANNDTTERAEAGTWVWPRDKFRSQAEAARQPTLWRVME